jgi:hypothetical protein
MSGEADAALAHLLLALQLELGHLGGVLAHVKVGACDLALRSCTSSHRDPPPFSHCDIFQYISERRSKNFSSIGVPPKSIGMQGMPSWLRRSMRPTPMGPCR